MQKHLIIVAAGKGTRMKSDRPKQFLDLAGQPVIIHTIKRFLDYDPKLNIVICVSRNFMQTVEGFLAKYFPGKKFSVVLGGETRFDSVRNGLQALNGAEGIVGIHDAARPLVSVQTIRTCFETAAVKGNAVPVVPVSESLRKISNNINSSVNRNEFKIVQTPQCFQVQKIKRAFDLTSSGAFTDDASVYEASGEQVVLVEGNAENIKLTSPADMLIAAALVSA